MADVKLDIIGDADKAEQELKKLQTRLDRVEQKSKQTGRTSQQANRKQQQSLRGTISSVAKLAAGYVGVQAAVRGVIQENERLSRGIDELLQKLPASELKLRLLSGQTREEFAEQLPNLREKIVQTPSVRDIPTALAIQQQLKSSGFAQKQLESGAALEAVLKFRAATGTFDAGPKQSVEQVRGISSFLRSQGAQRNVENILTTARRVSTLRRGGEDVAATALEFQDLPQLATEATALAQRGISRREQLASFASLTGEIGRRKAATGLRLFATRLTDIEPGGDSPKNEALKKLGLKPGQVDFRGESFVDVLDTLSKAQQRTDKGVFNRALSTLFGQEAQVAAASLIGKSSRVRELVDLQKGQAGAFQENVERFQESRVARQQGAALATEFQQRAVDVQRGRLTFKELRTFLDQARAREARERGGRLGGAAADFAALSFEISAGEKAGRTPREVAERIQSGFFGTGLTGPAADELTEVLRENNIRLQENTEEQKRANNNRPNLNRNANAE